jgi:phage terminase large subunit-like protein
MTTPDFDQTKLTVMEGLHAKLKALSDYQKYNRLQFAFPDSGPYSRDQYIKHLEFFKAGAKHRFRMLSGGNGSGKSYSMGYEIALHATGLYPTWWEGKRIKKCQTIWIVAESGALFRDSMQKLLFGNPGEERGTGLIPKEMLLETTAMQGVPGTIGSALVKNANGQVVSIVLKTFDMRRENLQAANVSVMAFDEEPPEDVYEECVMRTRGTKTTEPGIVLLAFTPLKGLTSVVMQYLPNGQFPKDGLIHEKPDYYSCRISWDDAPHLTESDKEALISAVAPNLRDARTKGIPALGSGRVYPFHEDDVVVNYVKIAPHWPRAYGLDFGWECTAAVWGAKDPETGIIYLYGEYYQGHKAPYQHAYAIKERGAWIPGLADPRGDKGSERDGSKLIDEYISLGLNLQLDGNGKSLADNSVNAGIARIVNLLESGLLKFTYNLENLINEFRVYRYDAKDPTKIAKNQKDHLMDAMKYLISRFDDVAISAKDYQEEQEAESLGYRRQRNGDDHRNSITGY